MNLTGALVEPRMGKIKEWLVWSWGKALIVLIPVVLVIPGILLLLIALIFKVWFYIIERSERENKEMHPPE